MLTLFITLLIILAIAYPALAFFAREGQLRFITAANRPDEPTPVDTEESTESESELETVLVA